MLRCGENVMTRHPNIPLTAWRFVEWLARSESVEAIVLFGSRALGDHEDRSDVDIAVCGSSISRLEWARMRDSANVAQSLYWISLVHLERNPAALKERILGTGVKIYERKKAD